MDLFTSLNRPDENWLPYDGIVQYHGPILSPAVADDYLAALLHDIDWKNDEALLFGKKIITRREVAWYGDLPYAYTYSNTTKYARSWIPALQSLRRIVEQACGTTFNACLLNLYHDGTEGMAWHSDDERDLEQYGVIASLSLGAVRKFAFRHKQTRHTLSLELEHGSLLVMKGQTQHHWLHRLPPSRRIHHARVNLTFRSIVGQTPVGQEHS